MFVQTEFTKSSNNNNDLSRAPHDPTSEVLFRDLDLVSRFCMPICSRDNEIREVALDVISKTVEGWLDGVGSPRHYRLHNSSNGCACADIVGNDVPREYLDLVALHLPIILRLSISCPFVNVREKCRHILEIVQVSLFVFLFVLCCDLRRKGLSEVIQVFLLIAPCLSGHLVKTYI